MQGKKLCLCDIRWKNHLLIQWMSILSVCRLPSVCRDNLHFLRRQAWIQAICGDTTAMKEKETNICPSLAPSDSNRIQTYNLLIRSQMLYSVELRSRCFSQLRCKGTAFFWNCKMCGDFFSKKSSFFIRFTLSGAYCSINRLFCIYHPIDMPTLTLRGDELLLCR